MITNCDACDGEGQLNTITEDKHHLSDCWKCAGTGRVNNFNLETQLIGLRKLLKAAKTEQFNEIENKFISEISKSLQDYDNDKLA